MGHSSFFRLLPFQLPGALAFSRSFPLGKRPRGPPSKYPKLGELRALFDAFDLDGDGYVSYEELCEYIDEPPARAIPTK